jgi:hypothetical protein
MARRGINKAIKEQWQLFEYKRLSSDNDYKLGRTCIFISHKKEDSEKSKEIADYIMSCGVDVYFDENDPILSNPEVNKDPAIITLAINSALSKSTHMICIISEKTKNSWWVPYEVGYVSNKPGFINKNIGILLIKGIIQLPEYLFLSTNIRTTSELDIFIKNASKVDTLLIERAKTLSNVLNHPLNKLLE